MSEPVQDPVAALLSGDVADRARGLELFSRRLVEGTRASDNRSPFRGFSTDFAQHRQYFRGDSLKHLDWKVWAKSDRLFIRQYEEFTNAQVSVLVDVSASMGFRGAGMNKLEFAVRCAAVLEYIAFLHRDSFSLHLFAEGVAERTPRGGSRRHLSRVFEKLAGAKAAGGTSFMDAFRAAAAEFTRRGLVVVLSDFMDDPDEVARQLGRFRAQKHDVIAIQVHDPAERSLDFVDVTRFVDMEGGAPLTVDPVAVREEYQRQFDLHQARLRQACLAAGVDCAAVAVEEGFDRPIGEFLRRRAALLL